MVEGIKDQSTTALVEPKKEKEDRFRWTRDPKIPIVRIVKGIRTETPMAVQITPYKIQGKFAYPEGPLFISFDQDVKKMLKSHPAKLSGWIIGTVHEDDKHFEGKDDEYHHCTIFSDDLGKKTAEKKRQVEQVQKAKKEAGKGWKMEQAGQERLTKQRNITKRRPRWVPGYTDVPAEFGDESEPELKTDPKQKSQQENQEQQNEEFFVLKLYTPVQLYRKHPMQKEERERTGQDDRDELKSEETHGQIHFKIKGTKVKFWRDPENHYGQIIGVDYAVNPDDKNLKGFISRGEARKGMIDPTAEKIGF